MPLRINFNVESAAAQRNLATTQSTFFHAVERLSSGLRINRSADDAAGLSISEKLRAQVKGTAQAKLNAQNAISMVQTGEGAMNEVHSMLQRMRELAVEAANDTLVTSDRQAVNQEMQQLAAEIDQVSARTQFNGRFLLDGSQASTFVASTSSLKAGTVLASSSNTSVTNVTLGSTLSLGAFIVTNANAASNVITISSPGTNSVAVTLSALLNGPGSEVITAVLGTGTVQINVATVTSITATALAAALAGAANFTVSLGAQANYQVGPNATGNDVFSVAYSQVNVTTAGIASALAAFGDSANGVAGASVLSGTGGTAQSLITQLDTAINFVSNQRGSLGAAQNRLEHTINYLGVANQNLASSESLIRNADVAAETAELTRSQILQQAAMAVLAQANQAPQAALQLLR